MKYNTLLILFVFVGAAALGAFVFFLIDFAMSFARYKGYTEEEFVLNEETAKNWFNIPGSLNKDVTKKVWIYNLTLSDLRRGYQTATGVASSRPLEYSVTKQEAKVERRGNKVLEHDMK